MYKNRKEKQYTKQYKNTEYKKNRKQIYETKKHKENTTKQNSSN